MQCSGIAQCSGALIGVQRQHVLTAGHCLVDSSTSQVTWRQPCIMLLRAMFVCVQAAAVTIVCGLPSASGASGGR